ncbi:MAG: vWA domain-containing protein, partial [Chitinophagaceae bacterium]
MSLDLLHDITFADPGYLWLLILMPALIYGLVRNKNKQQASLRLSSLEGLEKVPLSWKVRLRPVLAILRLLAITLIILSMARPQQSNTTEDINSNGIDIVICLDISGSMLAEDFQPNRIEAAKQVAMHFVDERPSDRIGLVIFAGESFTQCPITTDHAVLKEQISKVTSGMLEDGTAIGMGLGTSVDRLRQSKAKSKVIILMTDGVNNTGLVDPLTALEIAKAYGVK